MIAEKVRPRKALGQNFLINQTILNKIISFAELNKEDVVVEIGAGLGDLTALLANRARVVIALELDRRLISLLEDRFRENEKVRIVGSDALKFNYQEVFKHYHSKLKVIGNIPYYLSTALTTKMINMRSIISMILFMFQKEVAERIVARPGSKTYGPLSILSQIYADVSMVMEVQRSYFSPQPKVDSALVKFRMYQKPKLAIGDEDKFEKALHLIFARRRKTLLNALMGRGEKEKEKLAELCESVGINPMRRAETLTLDEFDKLFKRLNADR